MKRLALNLRRCLASAWTVLVLAGPVGLYYAARLARNERRRAHLVELMQRERDLHREHMRTLQHEHAGLVDQQQELHQAVVSFRKACEARP